MSPSGTLRWGVVGIGSFVESTTAPAMASLDTCDLIAVTSRSMDRAASFARAFHVPLTFDRFEEMAEHPDIDAIHIATPNSLHADQVEVAASAGKHVFCEKPLATNVADARRALRSCETSGVRLGIDFHNRHLGWVKDVAHQIAQGAIGEVAVVELDVGSGPRHYTNWRAEPDLAGLGTVHNVGVHALDFLRVLLADEPVEVSAGFEPAPGMGVEMTAMLLLRFSKGTLVYLNANERLAHPTNSIVIHGANGRIIGSGLTRSRQGGSITVTTADGETTTEYPAQEAHKLCIAGFTDSVLNDTEPYASGLDGLRSAELCDAIGRAARERRWVDVLYSADV